jgi:hypothetical protein
VVECVIEVLEMLLFCGDGFVHGEVEMLLGESVGWWIDGVGLLVGLGGVDG